MEILEILGPDGTMLGRKDRELVHRDGDWHRTAHIWALGDGGLLVLARRAADKHTWPGLVGPAAGGHLRPGEGEDGARREAAEELGTEPGPGELVCLGTALCEDIPEDPKDPGGTDRERREVYLWPLGGRAASLRPAAPEVGELIRIPLADFAALVAGEQGAGGLARAELVPSWGYYGAVLGALNAWGRGEARPRLGAAGEVRERLRRPA